MLGLQYRFCRGHFTVSFCLQVLTDLSFLAYSSHFKSKNNTLIEEWVFRVKLLINKLFSPF